MLASPPADLQLGQYESDTCLFLFEEQQGVVLESPLTVSRPHATNSVTAGTTILPEGTVVNSYLVHMDKIGSSATIVNLSGSLVFENDVEGVIWTNAGLTSTDGMLGDSGLTYETSTTAGRTLETTTQPQDDVVAVPNARTVNFQFHTAGGMDEARILTVSTPPFCTTPGPNAIVSASPPKDLQLGRTESNECILLFEEQQGFVLQSPLTVSRPHPTNSVTAGTITLPAGTVVNSYLVHMDKIGSSAAIVNLDGSHAFEDDVIGVMATHGSLTSTDGMLGDSGLTYETTTAAARGLETSTQPQEDVVAVPDARTVDFHFHAAGGIDNARILTGTLSDLSVIKTDPPGRAPTGRNLTYTVTVTNSGPSEAADVTVVDQLPSSVTFVSATSSQGSCSESGGTVTCPLGAVASGAVITIQIVVRPTQAGVITNSVSVASPTSDPAQGNNADSETTTTCRITSRRSSIPCG